MKPLAYLDGRGDFNNAVTSISSCAASRHRIRSDGLPMPRSIWETNVRSTSASSASWINHIQLGVPRRLTFELSASTEYEYTGCV